jgi:DNA polymerase-1
MELIEVCCAMERHGVLIDLNYVVSGLDYETKKIEEAKKNFKEDTGLAYKDSNKFFADLFTSRGEEFPRTEKGNPSFTADTLELLDTPTARLINKIRHHEKRAGTYWSSFLHHAGSDNVIHANIRQAGTTTGRFSYSDPNLQNLPSEEDAAPEAYVIRGSFIPRPGTVYASLDYQAIEYRAFLDIAGEHALIDKVNQGHDLHQATADMMGVSRKEAKTLGFMLLYGGGIKKLAHALGIPESDAKQLKELYFGRLPKVKQLISAIVSTAESRGYVFNFLGRRFWLGDFEYSYKMPNALIQGTCADVMKLAMTKIYHENLPGVCMLVTIHDELGFEVEVDKQEQIQKLQKLMESTYVPRNGLPMVVKAAVSSKSFAKRDLVDI